MNVNQIYDAEVAVIHTANTYVSKKKDGTWSCIMDIDHDKLVKRAEALKFQWERSGWGPYIISYGKIALSDGPDMSDPDGLLDSH